MSELGSAIELLRAESLPELPDARIEQDFVELHHAVEALEVERLRRLAELDRRRLFERDGHLSAASWLAHRCSLGWGQARDAVYLARALDRMPRVRRVLEAGAISLSGARVLAEAHDAEPEVFPAAEPMLVDAASRHSITELRRVVAHWRNLVASQRIGTPDAAEVVRARRRLHASVTLGGMVRLDADLDPETGQTFMTALGAVLDAEARSSSADRGDGRQGGPSHDESDHRTPAQRRADALGEICRGWLDRSVRPEVAGERPHLSVTVPFDSLVGKPGAGVAGELDDVGPIDRGTIRRLACDASVTRIVVGPRSEPLDVGRRTATVPPAIRRGLVVRDRHCRFPGCDRPQSWCDAHHVRHWADGGETSLANLVLLCRRHHRMTHTGFSLELVDGRPAFRRPDGSVLEERTERAPP